MNSPTHPPLDSAESARHFDTLSVEPARRSIELAFLHRITDAAKAAGTAILDNAAQSDADSIPANLARMQSPVFQGIARALEQSIPDDEGFGRFRDRN